MLVLDMLLLRNKREKKLKRREVITSQTEDLSAAFSFTSEPSVYH